MLHNLCTLSRIKHTVVELSTGNKYREEWTFLPNNWRNPIRTKQLFFDKNFLYVSFLPWFPYPRGTGHFLFLNLASRKHFWIQKEELGNRILANTSNIYDDNEFIDICFRECYMQVKQNEILLKCDSKKDHSLPELGRFSISAFQWYAKNQLND